MELKAATRPNHAQTGDEIKVITNYFKFEAKKNTIYKFQVTFTPELPEESSFLRSKIFRQLFDEVSNHIGFHIFVNTMVYAFTFLEEKQVFKTTFDNKEYEITLEEVCEIGEQDKGKQVRERSKSCIDSPILPVLYLLKWVSFFFCPFAFFFPSSHISAPEPPTHKLPNSYSIFSTFLL